MRVLLIEDDPLIARDVRLHLQRAGCIVEHAGDGEDGWFRGAEEEFSAAILDLGLPGMDGLSILRRWRDAGKTFPVIILTARANWQERVEGIDAGADDYLPKPFQMAELLARLRAIVRRSGGQASALLQAGSTIVDTRTSGVSVDGRPVELTPLEYRCLHHLMLNRGRNVSQAELTEHLWAQDFERESNSVEVLIGRLRRKLGRDLITTRRGFGYRVDAE